MSDTTFPYTPSNNKGGSPPGGNEGGGSPPGGNGGGDPPGGNDGGSPPGGNEGGGPPSFSSDNNDLDRRLDSTTYNTASEYIASLNSDSNWITYDSSSNKATITSVGDFVTHCKSASKDVGAFDSLSKSQAE